MGPARRRKLSGKFPDRNFTEPPVPLSECSECGAALRRVAVGIVCVVYFHGPTTIGVPFCRTCATSHETVSALARKAAARLVHAGGAGRGPTPASALVMKHDPGLVQLTIGMRGLLTERDAQDAADVFRQLRATSPTVPISFAVLGYDDDPRGLWQIPEVCRYVQSWARLAGLSDWRIAETIPWFSDELALLVQCGVFGDDHPFTLLPYTKH